LRDNNELSIIYAEIFSLFAVPTSAQATIMAMSSDMEEQIHRKARM